MSSPHLPVNSPNFEILLTWMSPPVSLSGGNATSLHPTDFPRLIYVSPLEVWFSVYTLLTWMPPLFTARGNPVEMWFHLCISPSFDAANSQHPTDSKKKKKPTFIFKRRLDLCLHPSFGPAEMWSYPRISRVQPIVSTLLTPQDRLSFSARLDLSPLGFTAPRKCGPTFTCSILGCSHKSAPNWLLRLALSLHSSLLGYHQFTSPWKCGPNFAFLHTCTLQDFKIFTPREGFPFLPH